MPQPSRRLRLIVPLIVGGLAMLIILLVATGEGGANRVQVERGLEPPADTAATEDTASTPARPDADASAPSETATAPAAPPPAAKSDATPPATKAADRSLESLRMATHPVADDEPVQTLGDLDDPDRWAMELSFTREGAGVTRIPYTNIWQTAAARRQAAEYFAARQRGDTGDYSLPAPDQRYVLLNEHPVSWVNAEGQRRERVISILSARSIEINGTTLDLTVAALDAAVRVRSRRPCSTGTTSRWRGSTGPGAGLRHHAVAVVRASTRSRCRSFSVVRSAESHS